MSYLVGYGLGPYFMKVTVMQALENLSLPFTLMLSFEMDGPNVNKSILSKMNQLKKEKGYPELVQCPQTCLIHVCHNGF